MPAVIGPAHPAISSCGTQAICALIMLRAFSSGCSAMTGIEAISNGVSVFKNPAPVLASKTMLILMVLLATMFLGITWFSVHLHIVPVDNQSVLSQLGHAIFQDGPLYYGLQFSTCLILLLAANTSFAGFPLLASIIAEDGYLPRQLTSVGDRMAFNNGIALLAIIAILLVIGFHADTHLLIPLYSIGVFVAFTLCQAGLVRVWFRRRSNGWHIKAFINALGCVATGIASLVIIESKFSEGAWIVVVAIPLMLWVSYKIKTHYDRCDKWLAQSLLEPTEILPQADNHARVVVPVSKVHKGTIAALQFARKLSQDVVALTIDTHSNGTRYLQEQWEVLGLDYYAKLVILESSYHSTTMPIVNESL